MPDQDSQKQNEPYSISKGTAFDLFAEAVAPIPVVGTITGFVSTVKEIKEKISDTRESTAELLKRGREEKAYKAAVSNPEVEKLLEQRAVATAALQLQENAQKETLANMSRTLNLIPLGEELDKNPKMQLPNDIKPDEERILRMDPEDRAAAIETRTNVLRDQIDKIDTATNQLNAVVTSVNSNPLIANDKFHKLEATHDLEASMNSTAMKSVKDILGTAKSVGASTANVLGIPTNKSPMSR